MIKFAIFDMDGTMFDTEEMFRRSWLITSEKYGLENADSVYEGVAGASGDRAKQILVENYGDRVDAERFFSERTKCTVDIFATEGIPVKAGCFELLNFLKEQNIPMVVATSTPMYITEKNLKSVGAYGYFCDIVTAEMVENGKPAPDIFLLTAEAMGFTPEECVVVEDSRNGVLSGVRAGMKVVLIPDMQPVTPDLPPVLWQCIKTVESLPELIAKENR